MIFAWKKSGRAPLYRLLINNIFLMNRHQQDADCKPDSVVKNHLSGPGVAAQTIRRLWRSSLSVPPWGPAGSSS